MRRGHIRITSPMVCLSLLLATCAARTEPVAPAAETTAKGLTNQARAENLAAEIETLQLKRAEYGIAAPIVMMSVGGGVAFGAHVLTERLRQARER